MRLVCKNPRCIYAYELIPHSFIKEIVNGKFKCPSCPNWNNLTESRKLALERLAELKPSVASRQGIVKHQVEPHDCGFSELE